MPRLGGEETHSTAMGVPDECNRPCETSLGSAALQRAANFVLFMARLPAEGVADYNDDHLLALLANVSNLERRHA